MNLTGSWRSTAAALALIGACASTIPARAEVKDGVDAWSRGDFEAAVRTWSDLAAKGDPDAQFNLAQAYKLGRGVQQDMRKAESLYARASANGHLQASDNLGLILFQRGDRKRAMPLIEAASARGDARAHYVFGLACFNGDGVAKDWVRAYALVSLAQRAGLPQAAAALTQMDQHIPIEQRQESVVMASRIAADAHATRARQIAASDLGAPGPSARLSGASTIQPIRAIEPIPATYRGTPRADDTDYARGTVPKVNAIMNAKPETPTAPALVKAGAPKPKSVANRSGGSAGAGGPWRVQLGAFAVPENADRLWARVKSRPELADHPKLAIPSGRVTRLLAGGFADSASAQSACNKLKSSGFECIVTRN